MNRISYLEKQLRYAKIERRYYNRVMETIKWAEMDRVVDKIQKELDSLRSQQ